MQAVLAINTGSSSVKFGLYEADNLNLLVRGSIDAAAPVTFKSHGPLTAALRSTPAPTSTSHAGHITWLVELLERALPQISLKAIGHRIVHGGRDFYGPVKLNAANLVQLEALIPFAPGHQPDNLASVKALASRYPNVPQIGCFDTAFHRTIPDIAQQFPIPQALTESGLVRFGFHGLSYQHLVETLPSLTQGIMPKRVLAAHLGNGASLCAIKDGRSVATTMGLTALDGLMMGTRSGAVDPGLVLHLIENRGMSPHDVNHMLNKEAGLLGVSGISADVRQLEKSEEPAARRALDLFAYRAGRDAASLIAALDGLDAIVFTGGIGENSAAMRARICAYLGFMNLQLDEALNAAHAPSIATVDSNISAYIIAADEEAPIARAASALA